MSNFSVDLTIMLLLFDLVSNTTLSRREKRQREKHKPVEEVECIKMEAVLSKAKAGKVMNPSWGEP